MVLPMYSSIVVGKTLHHIYDLIMADVFAKW